ncbi:carboxymuconolactone decarboxylase family protein [Negadavirga shengliensis]|uniref:Carboxymuconolactone decarboxylase family protein n=1 Tax=Negadavirga shengliensis TaxID=1389218 RepID=A0ABV9T6V6_9BACT
MMNTAIKTDPAQTGPRFSPIEKPKSLKLKMVYWFIKRKLGKVITPVKVFYPRFPEALGLAGELGKLHNRFTIPPRLQHLISIYTATMNGCAFCVDIGKASAKQKKLNPSIFDDLLRFEESGGFTAAEKAALAYVDEVNRNKHVSDAIFDRLQRYFSEEEIIQITLLNAIENLYNLMNAPLNIGSDELCELMSSQ